MDTAQTTTAQTIARRTAITIWLRHQISPEVGDAFGDHSSLVSAGKLKGYAFGAGTVRFAMSDVDAFESEAFTVIKTRPARCANVGAGQLKTPLSKESSNKWNSKPSIRTSRQSLADAKLWRKGRVLGMKERLAASSLTMKSLGAGPLRSAQGEISPSSRTTDPKAPASVMLAGSSPQSISDHRRLISQRRAD